MLKIRYHTSFKKDYKRVVKRGYDTKLMEEIIQKLAKGEQLPEKNKDHPLSGNYSGCRECHITPDWLLIYEIDNGELILYLTRTGTHSDLFKNRMRMKMESIWKQNPDAFYYTKITKKRRRRL